MVMLIIRNVISRSRSNNTSINCFVKSQVNSVHSKVTMDSKPVEKSIREKLEVALEPFHLNIINESYMHNVPKGSETHFKVVLVSKKFENKSLLERHRLINSALAYELQNGVHALSIVAKTPDQWSSEEKVEPSPKCLGGFGK